VLTKLRRQTLHDELEPAYRRDAQDQRYQEELSTWDSLAGDGFDA
jgi:hypothetical protein